MMSVEKAPWKTNLSFTQRLTNIQALTATYRQASPSASYVEAQSQAKRYESEAFDQANSQDEYNQMCKDAIDQMYATHSVAPVISSPPLDPKEEGIWEDSDAVVDIGKYRRCLHHADGLFSTVYKAKAEDGSLVALKVTTPHLMIAPHDSKREVRVLREASHSRVIPLREAFDLAGGQLILVFPFMRYNFDLLLHKDILTGAQTRNILRDLFQALAHLHSLGVIHRDIKPSNILLASPAGPAYLADFGIVWKEGDPTCEPGDEKITDVGTTCYRPPELLFGCQDYDTTLDLWAAGCVVAESVHVTHRALFDSGELGSELALLKSIFETLGTPTGRTWPGTARMPDWGKVQFKAYPGQPWEEILKGSDPQGRDLASRLVCYESTWRLTAAEALKHPFFES